ncbi:MAG: acyl-CoA thioesterase [Chitinophagaceae bacterium]
MARIKIDLPDLFGFTCAIPVRISDINYGGHVGNDAILSLIHEARLQYLQQYGYTELDLGGAGLIMADAAIEFKQELFYGETVLVSVTAAGWSRIGFDLFYKLEKKKTDGTPVLVAAAKTGMVCYDYRLKKVTAVPAAAVAKMKVTE